jgi:hypothetical protein
MSSGLPVFPPNVTWTYLSRGSWRKTVFRVLNVWLRWVATKRLVQIRGDFFKRASWGEEVRTLKDWFLSTGSEVTYVVAIWACVRLLAYHL